MIMFGELLTDLISITTTGYKLYPDAGRILGSLERDGASRSEGRVCAIIGWKKIRVPLTHLEVLLCPQLAWSVALG